MKILVAGDSFVSVEDFRKAFYDISKTNDVSFIVLNEDEKFEPTSDSQKRIREYLGSPDQLIRELDSAECLVVHGAPVTDQVLDASPNLKLVCCARGGPVNVDLLAATERKIPVVTAPGKNADAVADLAMAFMIMLSRNIVRALDHVRATKIVGADNYEGNQFFGHELGGKVLGLVGYGRVGSKVCKRALGFGMEVLVYDPYVDKTKIEAPGVKVTDFKNLISTSDFVSLHARESKENENLFGETEFRSMKPNSFFINTARPSMVDETALLEALWHRRIAGAAMDVLRYDPDRPVNPLLTLENVIVTPHIAGATFETTTKGAQIVATQLQRYLSGLSLETVINPQVLKT
ncbi:MAG TPA: NAD(P)-dependent oxidoreductase [Nitrososphaerales archaeon]|nr:NAD(P)-dependent oxidoreductase [Nitrososphaerales archaeon]